MRPRAATATASPRRTLTRHLPGDATAAPAITLQFKSIAHATLLVLWRCRVSEHIDYGVRTGRGVTLRANGRYEARLADGDRKMQVGNFESLEEAAEAIRSAREELWGEFAGNE